MYDPPKFKNAITLKLSSNESRCAMDDLNEQLSGLGPAFVSYYPSHIELQTLIGQSLGVAPDRVVVTTGGDDAIGRVLANALAGQRKKVVCHAPSFEMFPIYATQSGGQMDTVEWVEGDFPLESFLQKLDDTTALAIVVSPNNPTGGVIAVEHILTVADAAQNAGCLLLVDYAYIEFANSDSTTRLSAHENIAIVRTFSKAWGLAGLRVGYLVAPSAHFATTIRSATGPYPVSGVSLEMARRCLSEYSQPMTRNLETIKLLRGLLTELLIECGATPLPSAGNFVLAKFDDAETVWNELGADGIGVRKFVDSPLLVNRLRITAPATPMEYLQLAQSLCRIHGLDFESQRTTLGAAMEVGSAESILWGAGSQAKAIEQTDTSLQANAPRVASLHRQTKETNIQLELDLDGTGVAEISTGIGFLDHMLTALTFHSRLNLKLICDGDLEVDDHHTAEDCALALGTAIDQALGKRSGIQRFGYAYAPLDEALARTVLDLSGRPWPEIHLQLERQMVGTWACENITHFFQSFAMTLKCSLHVDVLRGKNDHHRAEAAFKSMAMALRQSLKRTDGAVPSTKGVL